MKKLIALILSLFAFTSIAGVDPKDAYQQMLENKAVIIDVREKDELPPGMVKGAKWFPLSKFKDDEYWKEDFKKLADGKTIYLYCRSGRRSGMALDILKKNEISSQNLGGYEQLKTILPTTK